MRAFETRFPLEAVFGHTDVTGTVAGWVAESGCENGVACLQVVGSTGGITTIEYESGALADLERAMERLAPATGHYAHNERWHDGNGFSHLRSAVLGTSLVVPVRSGALALGTWQQIVMLNFDNRPRERLLVGMLLEG
ncbi:MAG: YjbQ family protein [bacterium]|nr:YjbQ family protein [bacterium]